MQKLMYSNLFVASDIMVIFIPDEEFNEDTFQHIREDYPNRKFDFDFAQFNRRFNGYIVVTEISNLKTTRR